MKKTALGLAAVLATLALHASAAFGATVWAVGDGGDSFPEDDKVAAMIRSQGPFDRFLYLGDIYETGTAQEWANYYHPSFGQFREITSPTMGNHENPNALTGYDPYFGSQAPKTDGNRWYSFDLAGWHIISLNSQEPSTPDSPQVQWLRQDLARYPGTCTIAFWHRPRYSAALGGGDPGLDPFWAELSGKAAVALVGHHHNYQRLIPVRGITEFVVGTGGHFFHSIDYSYARLVAGQDTSYGALRMNLSYGRMDYGFVRTDGSVFDPGSMNCTPHTATPPPNEAPTAGFYHSPEAPTTGQQVTFTSTSADPDGQIVNWEWDLDKDGAYDDAQGPTATTSFATRGTHTVSLRVTDDKGATSVASRSLTVGNQAPNASFTWSPATPIRRENVTFTSTSADPDGTIVSQAWDTDNDGKFDDGNKLTKTRKFDKPGTYTVRLRVVDDSGAASVASRDVTVYRTRPQTTAKVAVLPFAGPRSLSGPRVRIEKPDFGRRYPYQPKLLLGSSRRAGEPVRLILRRRAGRRCSYFNSLRFRRASCRSRRWFRAGGRRNWRFRLPIDLPRGRYTLTAIVRSADGRLAAQSLSFRMAAPVKIKVAPIETGEDDTPEPGGE